jgi:hypothetical protein
MRHLSKLAAVGLAAAVLAAPAEAASTHAEYVAQVEHICQATDKPTVKAYKGFFKAIAKSGQRQAFEEAQNDDDDVRALEVSLGPFLKFYARISNIYGRETTQIAAIPAAPGDELAVAQWLDNRARAKATMDRGLRAAKNRKFRFAKHLISSALTKSSNAPLATIGDFDFKACGEAIGEVRSN